MNWQDVKKAAENGIKPVTGGFTKAKRGVVTLPSGQTVFIKMAVDDMTQAWLEKEIYAYEWLNEHGDKCAPKMLCSGTDGLALDDLSSWDWSDTWTHKKVVAAITCMKNLAKLSSQISGYFAKNDHFGPNPWQVHDYTVDTYKWVEKSYPGSHKKLQELLHDEVFVKRCTELAAHDPWQGNDLVHFDARSDNFAYNENEDRGVLVDWNWASLGNATFDINGMLINVQKSGLDVVGHFQENLDLASLAWILGFWIMALYDKIDFNPSLQGMRTHQIESLLVTADILKRLMPV